jgi:hypothetical protein
MTHGSGVSVPLISSRATAEQTRSDWTIRELAMYDLPALVEHVCQETGYDKVRFSPSLLRLDLGQA